MSAEGRMIKLCIEERLKKNENTDFECPPAFLQMKGPRRKKEKRPHLRISISVVSWELNMYKTDRKAIKPYNLQYFPISGHLFQKH